MSIASKVAAMLEAVQAADVAAMPPAERRRFADRCRELARIAEREAPRGSGVLAQLHMERETR